MASTEDELGTVLQKFSEHPIQSELEDFQYTSLRDVHDVILNFQNEQRVEKRMINFNRMKRFLEAISELGTEISRFSNCSPFLEPIWCSIRYLLQVSHTWIDALDVLLDAFQRIGERIPAFQQFHGPFQENTSMQHVLVSSYSNIIDFHLSAVQHFSDGVRRRTLISAWKDFEVDFQPILKGLSTQRRLLHAQSELFDGYQQDRNTILRTYKRRQEEENDIKLNVTVKRLCIHDSTEDYDKKFPTREGSAENELKYYSTESQPFDEQRFVAPRDSVEPRNMSRMRFSDQAQGIDRMRLTDEPHYTTAQTRGTDELITHTEARMSCEMIMKSESRPDLTLQTIPVHQRSPGV